MLADWGKPRYVLKDGKPFKFIAKPPLKCRFKAKGGIKTGRPKKYHKAFVKALALIWELFDHQCGKLLAPLVSGMMDFLAKEFNLSDDFRTLLVAIRPATIDRKLKRQKSAIALKAYIPPSQEAF